MKLFGFNITRTKDTPATQKQVEVTKDLEKGLPESVQPLDAKSGYGGYDYYEGSYYTPHYAYKEYFSGEKTPLELGPLRDSIPHYRALRYRAHEAHLKQDIIKIITGKFFKWVIGSGLKLQSIPDIDVLRSEGVILTDEQSMEFKTLVEARFRTYAETEHSDHSYMDNLHVKAIEAFSSAFIGGDCLCVLRVRENNTISMQVIDGEHVITPYLSDGNKDYLSEAKERGNTIRHGVEVSPTGEHIAYYVRIEDAETGIIDTFERIEARGASTGMRFAWLVYGDKHRIDHVRGIPVITQILEKVAKLDRYEEATVGSAEERAKIAYAVEHNQFSDGENPMLEALKQSTGKGTNVALETSGYALGDQTANKIAATTGKQTFNMPIGSQLKALESDVETNYDSFKKAVFIYICASVDIPSEVALQLYENSYSASRAAINSWEHIAKVYRKRFSDTFYQNFFKMWLQIEVIVLRKIPDYGFTTALTRGDFMAVEAFQKAKFTGVKMPHIDPLKEVKAIREMLGKNNTSPLISHEKAAEMLGAEDWDKSIEEYKKEIELIPEEENEPANTESTQQTNQLESE